MSKLVIGLRLSSCRRLCHTMQVRGMMICCPMTSRIKGYVFEVVVTQTPPSAVLADQIKSLDWKARGAVRERSGVSSSSWRMSKLRY